ncbi:MAG: response regulator [Gammaproteobacteria bacterium SHHR-1]
MAKILVVEDEEVSLHFYTTVLQGAGHEVLQARNGLGVAEIIHAQRPDLLLTDLVMPDCEGFEMIMSIRKTNKALPIIAMSAHANYLDLVGELGANAVLQKPFSKADLTQAVAQAL